MSYKWEIISMDYDLNQNGLEKVIKTVHWACSKTDENGNYGVVHGRHHLPAPDPNNFVAWDNLDEFTVLSWMTSDMVATTQDGDPTPADMAQASVDAQIAEQAAPTEGSGVPW